MSEMRQALGMIANLPKNVITRNPAGTYSFVGSVDHRLVYEDANGQPLDDETLRIGMQHGFGLLRHRGVRKKTYATEQAAIDALNALT